jgi:TIR domain-containing protein
VCDAFVSYATADRRGALAACDAISSLGIRLWIDVDEIPSRAVWRDAVQLGIREARVVLVILGSAWEDSPACRYELAVSVEQRRPLLAMRLPGHRGRVPATLPDDTEIVTATSLGAAATAVAARLATYRERHAE